MHETCLVILHPVLNENRVNVFTCHGHINIVSKGVSLELLKASLTSSLHGLLAPGINLA